MVQEKLQQINKLLTKVNFLLKPYKLAYVSPKNDCVLLRKNARFMKPEQFRRLTENIKRDGFLSQLPFAIKMKNGKYKILSGNHRVKAAIVAELEYILIMYLDYDEVPEEKQVAIQLSHNAITGQDDYSILAELYEQIQSLDLREYTGINEKELFDIEFIDLPSINESDIEFNEIRFYFTDSGLDRVDKIISELKKVVIDEKNSRLVLMDFYKFIDVMTEIKRSCNIRNDTVAFLKMVEICEEWLKNNKKDGDKNEKGNKK